MTDKTETTETTIETPETEAKPSNREAKYRKQLREAEAERDALRERVTTLQRGEAERVAGGHLTRPAALWAAGTSLDDLLTPEGDLDPEKVNAAAEAAAEALGAAAPTRAPRPDPSQGGNGTPVTQRDPFTEAFTPR